MGMRGNKDRAMHMTVKFTNVPGDQKLKSYLFAHGIR